MTGADRIINLLLQAENGDTDAFTEAGEQFEYFIDLFFAEFGAAWTYKEIEVAKEHVQHKIMLKIGGTKLKKITSVDKGVKKLFLQAEQEMASGKLQYIGTKQVTAEQFCLYSKALFWMAGFQLLN